MAAIDPSVTSAAGAPRLNLWELYELLCRANRLSYEPAADRWFLDGAEILPGTDHVESFSRAVVG
ncbi:hypothetical protein [Rhodospirillaceae bacterium SYSU D60014]|uniref:hypothetical protein n=1 Tax=Virgifigura deserti TaxID=2268457 RepID=UPI000E66D3FE